MSSARQQKTLPTCGEGSWNWFAGLGSDDVCRLKALGALKQIELHGLTFIQRAVAVLLDGGEVHEHIFARGALDESITLRPVEPLHCTFLSHGKNSFHNREECSANSRILPRLPEAPLREAAEFSVASTMCRGKLFPKRKRPRHSLKRLTRAGNSGVRQFGASFPLHPTNVNHLLVSPPDQLSGIEQQIIAVLKRFASKIRKKT
jgi:hypothetical protein